MKEADHKAAVHRLLPKDLYHHSNTGLSFNGVPDCYYDGDKADLWIEWKKLDRNPPGNMLDVSPVPGKKKAPGHLTELQYRWVVRRWNTGKNAAVIVALPQRIYVLLDNPSLWCQPVPLIAEMLFDRKEIAEWITQRCNG